MVALYITDPSIFGACDIYGEYLLSVVVRFIVVVSFMCRVVIDVAIEYVAYVVIAILSASDVSV